MSGKSAAFLAIALVLSACRDCYSEAHPGTCLLVDGVTPPADDTAASGECPAVETDALAILEARCHACHGAGGTIEGGFNYVLDVQRLIEEDKIRPGDPDNSYLLQRIESGAMPPAAITDRPTAAEIATLRAWIEGCVTPIAVDHPYIDNRSLFASLSADLRGQEVDERAYYRYISLVPLYNAGATADELESYRVGLSKLLNSLSRDADIAVPVAVDATNTLFRIDLRAYAWLDALSVADGVDGWEELVKRNPYGFQYDDPEFEYLQQATGTRTPVVNGDWLVYAASVSPLYEEILPLPDTADAFLATFGVESVAEDVRTLQVARAGFYQSGVSLNNRMIERHDTTDGACWVSYDFASSAGSKNLFAHPLDDDASFRNARGDADFVEEDGFVRDGGELICSLPNGLQVYYLTNAVGAFLAEGPLSIVSDPANEEGGYTVLNARSCMNCHYAGTIAKSDEIAESVLDPENVFTFSADELNVIREVYEEGDAAGWLTTDGAAFVAATVEAEVPTVYATEPVYALSQAFAEPLTEARVLAELGLDPDEASLLALLNASGDTQLRDDINQVFTAGTVDRRVFLPLVQRLLCATGQGATCPGEGETCSSPDFDLDGDGALDVYGLPCPAGTTCVATGADAGACMR